jgi:predicted nucleic acid-binding protein
LNLVVLDASALVVFFEEQPGAERVADLLRDASQGTTRLMMNAVNWGEVYYSIWRTKGREAANRALAEIAKCRIEIVEVGQSLARLAAEFRIRHRLPYADCFAAALAYSRKASLAATDSDFARVKGTVSLYRLR